MERADPSPRRPHTLYGHRHPCLYRGTSLPLIIPFFKYPGGGYRGRQSLPLASSKIFAAAQRQRRLCRRFDLIDRGGQEIGNHVAVDRARHGGIEDCAELIGEARI